MKKNSSDTSRTMQKAPRAGSSTATRWVEWSAGLISAVIVSLMIGWVTWEAFTESTAPPAFSVVIGDRAAVDGGYRVSFDITNEAAQTAAAVVVRGEVLDGERSLEEAEVTFDYVPGESTASGSIFFSSDPGSRPIRIRAIGYTDP